MQIQYNKSPRREKIEYIVIHDTGNTNIGANSEAHFNYFNSGNKGASADCFVDSNGSLWVNDFNKFYTWHCGDGKGKITNSNSVGIELCVNKDGDYNKAYKNLIKETVSLARKLNIKSENIVRHFDASGKNCPASMGKNNWEVWKNFKSEVGKALSEEFNDIDNHYGKEQIKELKAKGIVNGDGKGNFNPENFLTRGDMAIIISNLLKYLKDEQYD